MIFRRLSGGKGSILGGKGRKALLAGGVLCAALGAPAAFSNTSSAIGTGDCLACHAGQEEWPLAPDVSSRWFGSGPGQDGGHGDDDHFPALACTGTLGCHDLDGGEGTHLNGILEGAGRPSRNTYHLKDAFLSPASDAPWAVAEAFNIACAESCHLLYGVSLCAGMGHAPGSDIPYTPRFGTHLTPADADGSFGRRLVSLPLDSDLTTLAAKADPDFGICTSCHDPHGTDTDRACRTSNRMVRREWMISGELCSSCHMEVNLEDDGDGDGIPDVYDPLPSDPGGTAGYVSDALSVLSRGVDEGDGGRRGEKTAVEARRLHILERSLLRISDAVAEGRYRKAAAGLDRVIADLAEGKGPAGELAAYPGGEEVLCQLRYLSYLVESLP